MNDPLENMEIRRGKPNNAFGWVRTNRDGSKRPHQGWDLWAPVGTPTYSIADGLVEFVKIDQGAYGTQVCISFDHSGKLLYAFYAHLSHVYVTEGFEVKAGQMVGLTGMTGNASQVPSFSDQHLHFEIREKVSPGRGLKDRLDPADFLGYDLLTCSAEEAPVCELD